MLHGKLSGIDFILPVRFGHFLSMGGRADEYGTDRFCSSHGFPASAGFPQVRCSLPCSLQGAEVFLQGSVFLHGFCSAHLSGEPARHRGLPAGDAAEALAHGNPRAGLTEHAGRREPKSRLAHLRRLCEGSYRYGEASVCERRLRHGVGGSGVCARLHHHRPVSLPLSLGEISSDEGRHQTAPTPESAREYPRIHPCLRREAPRCPYPRHAHSAARFLLCDGSGLSGFRTALLRFIKVRPSS